MYRKSTLRRMPQEVRDMARLTNELESVLNRLRNRLPKWEQIERDSRALAIGAKLSGQEHPRYAVPGEEVA